MFDSLPSKRSLIEPLEARIAPASAVASAHWVTATFGAPIALHAGDGLSTAGANGGYYLLYVEKGDAFVFLTDLNNNGDVEFNEVTGISAGDGLRLTSFVDIHGDIVTNLVKTTAVISGVATTKLKLSDSDNNSLNDPFKIGDGRVLQNSRIDKIELRSLTSDDFTTDQNNDGSIDGEDALLRKAYTSYSIFGNIYAGKGFGSSGNGLTIDTTGMSDRVASNFGFAVNPSIGSIYTGTAAGGQFYSFGASRADDLSGTLLKFTPPSGQAGGDIIGVRAADSATSFNINGLFAGNGGISARGGNIQDVTLFSDDVSGYQIIAGNGGGGPSGGAGGSILGFSDLASQTGKVVIQSGTGGAGTTGAGGNGGNFSFETFDVFGNVSIALGSGGNGFTAGGNGASLAKGVFVQPVPGGIVPGNAYGTLHQATVDADGNPANGFEPAYTATIGTHAGVDIDGDGFGDFVFTTKTMSQVVVTFGNGAGGFQSTTDPDGITIPKRIYLSGLRNPEALIVNDLNGDGHPDIAVGSSDDGSQAGVAVFLAQFEDGNNDGLQPIEDRDQDGFNDFLGFSDARFSALPQLDTGDPDTGNAFLPYWQGPSEVSGLTAGDYDGDGVVELAAAVTYYFFKVTDDTTGLTESLSTPRQVLVYLTPDTEVNNTTGATEFTGQFYADFGTREQVVNGTTVPPAPRRPFIEVLGEALGIGSNADVPGGSLVFETTALTTPVVPVPGAHDVIFVGLNQQSQSLQNWATVVDYSLRDSGTVIPFAPVPVGNDYIFGSVDTNRNPGQVSLQPFYLGDFTVVDLNNDRIADLGAISGQPAGFMVGVVGDGFGNGTPDSGTADQAGNFFGTNGYGIGTNLHLIKSADFDVDGFSDDLVVLQADGGLPRFEYFSGPQAAVRIGGTGVLGGQNPTEYFLDPFLPQVNTPSIFGLQAAATPTGVSGREIFGTAAQRYRETGLKLSAGDGGDALIGRGGIGGSLGSLSKLSSTVDPLTGLTDLLGVLQLTSSGTVRLFAGTGGDGFTAGGKGGNLGGVVVRPVIDTDPNTGQTIIRSSTVTLTPGNGGRGISGLGGAGGDLTQISIDTNLGTLTAFTGAGGDGRIGGDGGDLIGNGTSIPDATATSISVIAGKGGNGIKKGGRGGNIANFAPDAGTPSVVSGTYRLVAGAGGNAIAGTGGDGGDVTNSSPRPGDGVQLAILVQGGAGGDGIRGGHGGDVSKFTSTPAANSKKVGVISFLGGKGGNGTSGNGGNGGDVTGIAVPTRGGGPAFLTNFAYNRVLGGDGGTSSGGKGGAGGDVANINSSASEGSFAVVSGAGGDGLSGGGKGGDIRDVELSLGSSTGVTKGLVIAGAGGDATAFVSNPNDPGSPNQGTNAFGGKVGIGGNGGNIIGFKQLGNIGVAVDLISGDGGDTINYGSVKDKKGYGGIGGSIQKVKMEGDIGDLSPTAAIVSYNDILNGETMQTWVNANIRTNPAPNASLTNADGNVGIVVGIAGRSKAVVTTAGADPANPASYTVLPSRDVPNGSLIDIEARNIMSAIAGSVDRIASIQVIKNLRVLGGIIGADKPAFPGDVSGDKNYEDQNGLPIGSPVREGRLVDGAVIAKVIFDASGKPGTLPSDRVFIL